MRIQKRFALSNFFIPWKVKKQLKTRVFLIRWIFQKIDSGNFPRTTVCSYMGRGWSINNFSKNSTVRILRSTPRLLGCFQKSFHISKVKNPKRPAAQIFQFFNFVPHDPNYHLPNFCAIKTIFHRERAKMPKTTLLKILRQVPTLTGYTRLRVN